MARNNKRFRAKPQNEAPSRRSKDMLYASNAALDIVYLDAPMEPVLLDEMSLDFSVISEEEQEILGRQPRVNHSNSLIVDEEYFCYYPVNYQDLNISSFIIQSLLLGNIAYSFPSLTDNNIVLMLSLDSIINIMVFIADNYLNVLNDYFYRETFIVKTIYLLLIYPFIIYPSTYLSKLNFNLLYRTDISGDYLRILLVLIINLPIVVNYVVNTNLFRKYYYLISNELHYLGKFLVCKKIAKAINRISKIYLHRDPKLTGRELVEFLPEISVQRLLTFCCASFVASFLFYFELDGLKFYTVLVRQYCFREYLDVSKSEKKRLSNREFIFKVIENRDWIKFTDAYTLNRLLKLYIELNKTVNGGLFRGETNLYSQFQRCLARLVTSISVASLFKFAPYSGLPFYVMDSVLDVYRAFINRREALALAVVADDLVPSTRNSKFRLEYYGVTFSVFILRTLVMIAYYYLTCMGSDRVLLIILLEAGYLGFGNVYFVKFIKDLVNILSIQIGLGDISQW